MAQTAAAPAQTLFDRYRPFLQSRPCVLCGATQARPLPTREKYGFPVRVNLCARCGLLFLNPVWSRQGYDRFYEQDYRLLAGKAQPPESRWEEQRAFGEWLLRETAQHLTLSPESRMLEIGCDEGGTLALLRERTGARAEGVEPNQAAAHRAQGRGLEVAARAFTGSEFESDRFDFVILARTLNHVVSPIEVLAGVRRILKEGGFFYTDMPDVVRASSLLRVDAQMDHPLMYGKETSRLLLERAGFSIAQAWQWRKTCCVQLRYLARKTGSESGTLPSVACRQAGRRVFRRMLGNAVKTPWVLWRARRNGTG